TAAAVGGSCGEGSVGEQQWEDLVERDPLVVQLELVLVVGVVIRLVLGVVDVKVRVMERDPSQLGLGGEGSGEWDVKEFLSGEVLRIKGHGIERVGEFEWFGFMESLVLGLVVMVMDWVVMEGSLVQVEEVLWVEVEKRLNYGVRFEEVVLRRWLDGGLCGVVGDRCDER
ncbi:hypothetical protein ACLOJK_027239, partial [Asimina triloba]